MFAAGPQPAPVCVATSALSVFDMLARVSTPDVSGRTISRLKAVTITTGTVRRTQRSNEVTRQQEGRCRRRSLRRPTSPKSQKHAFVSVSACIQNTDLITPIRQDGIRRQRKVGISTAKSRDVDNKNGIAGALSKLSSFTKTQIRSVPPMQPMLCPAQITCQQPLYCRVSRSGICRLSKHAYSSSQGKAGDCVGMPNFRDITQQQQERQPPKTSQLCRCISSRWQLAEFASETRTMRLSWRVLEFGLLT